PHRIEALLQAFAAFTSAYLARVDWEDPLEMERRCATLLPGLLLARIDGKSPVEYIAAETDKQRVRDVAGALLIEPPTRLSEVASAWPRRLVQ
ncbi:MAG: hypothetical protein QOJ52_4407, partial [Acidimicrobiaceae bacterium]|nr:hypothetical protein [Acidimicrobiaceae bacterium]